MESKSRRTCATEIFESEDCPTDAELAPEGSVPDRSNEKAVGEPIFPESEGEYVPLREAPPPALLKPAAPAPAWAADCVDAAEANCDSGVTVLDLGEVTDWPEGNDGGCWAPA